MSKKSYDEVMAERERGTTRPYTPDHHNHLLPQPPPSYAEPFPLFKGKGQAMLIFLAVLLIGYAGYGLLVDDLYLPGKRASLGQHYHGAAAGMMFMMLLIVAVEIITLALSRYDPIRKRITNQLFIRLLTVAAVVFMVAGVSMGR